MRKVDPSVVAVIPARWASTRFPGKPMAELAGEPMIAHVVRRASEATTVDHVIVATDDERIAEAAAAAGAEAVMTGECPSGTDRVAAAVAGRDEWEIVINVQGDEPLLSGDNIDVLVSGLMADDEVRMSTLCRPLEAERAEDPNAVKVVRDVAGPRSLLFALADPLPEAPRGGVEAVAAPPRNLRLSGARRSKHSLRCRRPTSNRRKAWSNCGPWRTVSRYWY